MNSGYVMLDAGGIDLSDSTSQEIVGSWKRAKEAMATNKPIFAFNTVYGSGNPLTPVPVFGWNISSKEVVLVGATLHIHVKDDDSCVVVDVAT